MKNEFDIPVGLSDHSVGKIIPLGAVAMGANLIEKHFRDIRNTPSPDDIVALEKEEFSSMIDSIRIIEMAKGDGIKEPTISERENLETNRVSIVTLRSIKTGEKIASEMIDIRRPGNGLAPKFFEEVLRKKAKIDIPKETPVTFEMLE